MKRFLALLVVAVLLIGTTGYATSAMKVKINGQEIAFKAAPKFDNNVLMVPFEETLQALAISAKWDMGTNTLEVTDGRAQKIAELQAQINDLQARLKTTPAADTTKVTKETLVSQLQAKYGSFKSGDKQFRVTWELNPYSDSNDPLITADINPDDFLTFLGLPRDGIMTWFRGAAALVAGVYPAKSAVLLVYHDYYTSYPSANWDHVSLTNDFRWSVTEYLIWGHITNGQADCYWDD